MRVKKLRKSGLRVLDEMPWGRHFSLFYETKEDLLEMVVPYLKAGLEANEFCMWVTSGPITRKDAMDALRRGIPALRRYLAEGQLKLISARRWYRTESRLDLPKAMKAWDAELASAVARGFEGVRVAASAVRLKAKEWSEFLDYEDSLNGFANGKAILVLCAYPLGALKTADLVGVTRTHPSVLVKRSRKWEAL
jgi:hypothetical protein